MPAPIEHKPIVLIDGEFEQLPDGDYIARLEEAVPQDKEVDFDDPEFIYKGWADVDSLTSDPVWKIQRIQFVGVDKDPKYRWASQAEYTNIWDNRVGLTYGVV